jgi:phenylacetate-CoA ligase
LCWLDDAESWRAILQTWEAIFAAAQVRADDRFFFPFSFGPFLGFWGAFDAASRKDRFVVTAGGMTTPARLQLLVESQCTFVLCTPTYALRLAEVADEMKLDLAASKVRGLILAGEPGASAPATRSRIESAFGARVFDHYGMTEIGPLSAEYVAHPGKAFLVDQAALAEFIDPKTGQAVPEGELGELVVTNLGRWSSPLLRYRTGDLVRWRRNDFDDRASSIYLEGGVLGRVDDMVWIKGNNVFPTAVEQIVREFADVGEFVIEAASDGAQTQLTIRVEPRGAEASSELPAALARRIQDRLYFRPRVLLVPPGSLPRYEMKAQRFRRISAE